MLQTKQKEPKIKLSYENKTYIVEITFDKNSTIITDGKTLDELMNNIQDALECHFWGNEYDMHFSIPMITFNHFKSSYALN